LTYRRYEKQNIAKYYFFVHIKDGEKSIYAFQGAGLEHYKTLRDFKDRGELFEFYEFDELPTDEETDRVQERVYGITSRSPWRLIGWQGGSKFDWVIAEVE
jgi:hypothetical protein